MTLAEQVAEAKKMHWGMYCGICDTCTRDALCSVACPDGGVDNGKIYDIDDMGSEIETVELGINFVKVVKCKDCKYASGHSSYSVFGKPLFVCNHVRQIGREGFEIHTEDWFCADGERRESKNDSD